MTANKLDTLLSKMSDKEYRDAFVDAEISHKLAFQIKNMRISHSLTQDALAEKLGTKQSVISRLENPENGKYTLSTLKQLAQVFDVALQVKFSSFVDFAIDVIDEKPESIDVQPFKSCIAVYKAESKWSENSLHVFLNNIVDFAMPSSQRLTGVMQIVHESKSSPAYDRMRNVVIGPTRENRETYQLLQHFNEAVDELSIPAS